MTDAAAWPDVLAATRERALQQKGPIPLDADSEFPDGIATALGLDFSGGTRATRWQAWKKFAGQVREALRYLAWDGTLVQTGDDAIRGSVMLWAPDEWRAAEAARKDRSS